MPQKLIRLTSETNDGIFDGLFNEDITIKQNSEIAFQSLTLERLTTSLTVNEANEEMTFFPKTQVTGDLQVGRIEKRIYEKGDTDVLMADIEKALNGSCDMLTLPETMNLQWKAEIDETEDKAEISVRPSPFFPLVDFAPGALSPIINSETLLDKGTTSTPSVNNGGVSRLTFQTAQGLLNECYLFNTMKFIKSTGALRVRLGTVSLQNLVNRPAFTIALVDQDGLAKLRNGTITYPDLTYAIQVNAPEDAFDRGGYSYISEPGSAGTSPTDPFVKIVQSDAGGAQDNNDCFEIQKRNGLFQGFIHQTGVATTVLPSSTTYDVTNDYYPVVFFHLASVLTPSVVANVLQNIQCSLDPWQTPSWYDYVTTNPALARRTSTLPELVQYDTVQANVLFKPDFTFQTDAIATYLGYTNKALVGPAGEGVGAVVITPDIVTEMDPNTGLPYDREQGFTLTGKQVASGTIDLESYIVDTQTFTLDSYDSYGLSTEDRLSNAGGSRRNLLATIPAEETAIPASANERIVYEPNTLDYIAIKNRSDIITRQIRLRLLNSTYNPVTVAGLAAITVLIRDPD
tara:strand:+ start:260 stop:1975 length:1716 start_codon:yes stop_codon:yes gene_type:complete